MSAYLISYEQLNIICNYVYKPKLWSYRDVGSNDSPTWLCKCITEIGQTLWSENNKSVNYRYNEIQSDPIYKFKRIDISHISVVQFLKFLDSLEYQSCEHSNYEKSKAYKLIIEFRSASISYLPGWEEAKWAI